MRKRSVLTRALVGVVKLIGKLFCVVGKGVWFVVHGVYLMVRSSVQNEKVKAKQPKGEAQYAQFKAKQVKGSWEKFEQKLLNQSLIVAIVGRRGSGKSALGFKILENVHAKVNRAVFALGVGQDVLPSWIKTVQEVQEVSSGGIVLVDESALTFGSRESMSKKNRALGELLAIARHKDLSLIFITQNTGMMEKNVLRLCDVIFIKEGSLLQERMERSALKELYATATSAFKTLSDTTSWSYVVDAEFEGLISASLPSFWSEKVSKNQK